MTGPTSKNNHRKRGRFIRKKILFLIFLFLALTFSAQKTIAQKKYTLEELYMVALENAEKVLIAKEEVYLSERQKDKALSVLFPKLSAFGSFTKYNDEKFSQGGVITQPNEAYSWGLRLDQSFSLSGRELIALRISQKGIEKSKYDLYSIKESYLVNVSLAYFNVLKAKKFLEIANANVQRLVKHRDAALTRLKVGEVTKTALLRAEAELSGAKSELIRADNNLKLAKSMLATTVGLDENFEIEDIPLTEEGLDLDFLLPRCKLLDIECLKQTAFSERADLKSLKVLMKISQDQISYTKGTYFPTLIMEGAWIKREENPSSALLNKESIYGGIKILFPFFEGGLRRAEVREAESKMKQAELIYEDSKKMVGTEVENAYFDLITLKGMMKSLEDQLSFAKENFQSISKQFEFGLASSIDVIDANTLLITSERQLAEVIYNFQMSKIRLQKAIGILLKSVNGYLLIN
ncbi:MAG: TolC family protein [Thermodesulfovibrionales bacterium]|nr:TolC family protein [Thermodesulfovibrionales bacterium]